MQINLTALQVCKLVKQCQRSGQYVRALPANSAKKVTKSYSAPQVKTFGCAYYLGAFSEYTTVLV